MTEQETDNLSLDFEVVPDLREEYAELEKFLDSIMGHLHEWHNENHGEPFAYCSARPCRSILLEIRDL